MSAKFIINKVRIDKGINAFNKIEKRPLIIFLLVNSLKLNLKPQIEVITAQTKNNPDTRVTRSLYVLLSAEIQTKIKIKRIE